MQESLSSLTLRADDAHARSIVPITDRTWSWAILNNVKPFLMSREVFSKRTLVYSFWAMEMG